MKGCTHYHWVEKHISVTQIRKQAGTGAASMLIVPSNLNSVNVVEMLVMENKNMDVPTIATPWTLRVCSSEKEKIIA